MACSLPNKTTSFLLLLSLVLLSSLDLCSGSRKLAAMYQQPANLLTYHKGPLLQGDIPASILWYGKFTASQKSIISDFLLSLTAKADHQLGFSATAPSVSRWWNIIDSLLTKAGKKRTHVSLANQVSDENCSIGKLLKKSQISELASKTITAKTELVLVLTAEDVAVEGFCMSSCGSHGSLPGSGAAYIWVGNSATQCPGQCAWPFHQPLYGPQSPPLVAPNGDFGIEGMVINIATLLAGTVTNPSGGGYFQGEAEAPVEVASACPGVFGKGAYPGYAGELKVDGETGASYNVEGVNGRKYLVPALFDPATSVCSSIV